jgi:hypothetical protein
VIILVVVAIPLLVMAVLAMRRSKQAGEHPPNETEADRARTEQEFAEAERYQDALREQEHERQHPHDPSQ